MQYDNPARRLHDILSSALAAANKHGSLAKTSSNTIWNKVFGEEDGKQRLAELDDVHYLIQLTQHSVLRLQRVPNKQIYLKPLEDLRDAIHRHGLLANQWANLHNRFNKPMLLDFIAATADAIDNEAHLILLSEAQTSQLLEGAELLLKEVQESTIDKPLKVFLTVRLEEICSAIRHYSVSGSEGLRRVVEANIGSAFLQSAGLIKDNEGQTLLKKFLDFMLKCGTALGIAADVEGFLFPAMSEVAKKLLSGDQ